VEVNEYSDPQLRENLGQQVVDVASHLDNVRRVDEQDVVLLQRREEFHVDVLNAALPDRAPCSIPAGQEREESLRIRIDERELDRAVEEAIVGVEHCARAVSRAGFDDSARAVEPEHRLQHDGVADREENVVGVVAMAR
jgi:hypothetical protein